MRKAAAKKGKAGGGGRFLPCPPSAPGTSPCRRWHEEVVFLGHPRRAGGREENTPGGSRGGESGAPRTRRRGPRGLPSPLHKPLGTWAGGAAATPFLHGKRGDCNTETAAATRPRGPRSCLSAAGPGKATGKASVNAGSVLCSPQRVTSIFQAAPPAGLFLLLPSFLRSLCTPRKRRRRDEEHFEQRSQALRPPSAGFGASPAPPALECPLLRFLGRVKPGGSDFPRPAVLIRRWGSSFSPGGSHQPQPAAPRKNTKRRRALGFWHFLIFIFFS